MDVFNTDYMISQLRSVAEDINKNLDKCMDIIGRRFVRHTKTILKNKWYKKRKPSDYYQRMSDGSFLDSITYTKVRNEWGGVSLYIYSDPELISTRPKSGKQLGAHMDVDGRDVRDSIGEYLDQGNGSPTRGRGVAFYKGIRWKDEMQRYGDKKFNDDLLTELKRRGVYI